MRAAKVTLSGREYYLAFNGAAMFEIEDAFGGANKLLDAMKGSSREAFDATCGAAAILSEQGELARRALGYENAPFLSEDVAKALASPMETVLLRNAVSKAIFAGYDREVESDEDVDLVLLELERKEGKG